MTKEHKDLLDELKNKIKNLNTLYIKSRECNIQSNIEIEYLKEALRKQQNENKELKEKYNTLKTAKSILAPEQDNHEAKIRINKMVREIDKCIALLNS
jgi:arginine deiminase